MPSPEQPNLHHTPESIAKSEAGSAIRPDQEHISLVDKLSILLRRFLPAHKTQMQKDVEEALKAAEKEEKAWQDAYKNPQDRFPYWKRKE